MNTRILWMIGLVSALLMCSLTAIAQTSTDDEQQDETELRYITEELYIFMHAGPGRQFRILGSVNAGEQVSILAVDESGEYTEILSSRQRTGWVETKFITESAGQRTQLPALQQSLSEKNQAYQQLTAEFNQIQQQNSRLNKTITELNQQLEDQQQMRAQVQRQLSEQTSSEQQNWFIKGGGLVLASIILGYILNMLPRRQKRRSEWS